MEKNKKFGMMAALIYFVIFVAYNLFVFLIFKNYNNIFWISYVFMIIVYLIHIGCTFYIGKNLTVRAAFFGISLFSFSVYFAFAELFVSFVFMIFRTSANVRVAVLIQSLLLCIFVVIAVVSLMTRDVVSDVDKKIKENVGNIRGLNVDVEMLIQRCTDTETTSALNKLSEIIKYSNPMSTNAVATQDQMIMQYMPELRMAFDSDDMEKVKDLCKKLELLFIERNKKIMAFL